MNLGRITIFLKVIKKSNVSDRKQFDPGHGVSSSPDYGQPHFRQLRRSSSCGSLRTKACKGACDGHIIML